MKNVLAGIFFVGCLVLLITGSAYLELQEPAQRNPQTGELLNH